jgi:hypothetical protein
MARLAPVGIDQVLLSNRAHQDLETELGLLGEVQAAVAASA